MNSKLQLFFTWSFQTEAKHTNLMCSLSSQDLKTIPKPLSQVSATSHLRLCELLIAVNNNYLSCLIFFGIEHPVQRRFLLQYGACQDRFSWHTWANLQQLLRDETKLWSPDIGKKNWHCYIFFCDIFDYIRRFTVEHFSTLKVFPFQPKQFPL